MRNLRAVIDGMARLAGSWRIPGLRLHILRLLLRGGIKGLFGLALLYPWLQPVKFPSIRVQEPFVLYRGYLSMPGMM